MNTNRPTVAVKKKAAKENVSYNRILTQARRKTYHNTAMESMKRAANVSEQGQMQEYRRGDSEEQRGGSDAVGLPRHAEQAPSPEERPGGDGAVIEAARRVGEAVLGPNAQDSDRANGPNPVCIRALADAGLLGMGLPRQYGGLDASGAAQREVSEILASYCGVTTFTQAQHHGPSRMICNGPNQELKDHLLPDLASGKRLCAVSFAHLRRPGPPALRATPSDGGYRLDGTTPWVTGWGLMDQVVFGATLPDERFVYVWVPARREDFADVFANLDAPQNEWGQMTASAPLSLCAMNASATVELTCHNLWVPDAHRLSESDRDTMRRNDRNGVLGATAMPIGCATGSVRLLCETAERRHISAIGRAAASVRA